MNHNKPPPLWRKGTDKWVGMALKPAVLQTAFSEYSGQVLGKIDWNCWVLKSVSLPINQQGKYSYWETDPTRKEFILQKSVTVNIVVFFIVTEFISNGKKYISLSLFEFSFIEHSLEKKKVGILYDKCYYTWECGFSIKPKRKKEKSVNWPQLFWEVWCSTSGYGQKCNER